MLLRHICLWALSGVAASAALAAGVSLVTIQQAGDWARVYAIHQLGTISLPTLLLQIGTRVQCWALVSRSSPGKCQTLIYTQSCIWGCWAIALPSTEQIVPQLSV